MTYGSVTREQYRERLALYADMGCNILRVWGGSIPEKKEFYDLCDELGLMVWQEFPLSSSGADNYPPEDRPGPGRSHRHRGLLYLAARAAMSRT